ncbi:acyl-CoA synthetase [Mycolicibacterium porcinum]|uniref:Acyl-CoA synthetase n=1 Tax=Mycolicibacterium porcinum TaxID=39693 RepID=A0AAW5SV49_9MYCO|nr:acyl-CoA synthetase [Mycolicibacterium porcinum]MCV7386454.1 acyl-CoA synthetase [Mycolicibacterium porcinum]ORB39047.1 acyl-CoA synthetase [Mycolicibacterium porcinum]CDO30875.1 acyl-CoA synthetase [Mycolicibacterium vulneris]
MELQFATIWEAIAEAVPDQIAVVYGSRRIAWGEYERRAAQLASALSERGLGTGSKIGLLLYNCNEYVEAQFAGFKLRAVPVNVNYRYLDQELSYVIDNSDSEAVVYHSSLSDRVAGIRDHLPRVKLWVEVDDGGPHLDGSIGYEDLLAAFNPAPPSPRSGNDIYMLYTGGTTGNPKGVLYQQESFIQQYLRQVPALMGRTPCKSGEEAVDLARTLAGEDAQPSSMPVCPLMHGSGQWAGVFAPHLFGGKTVLLTSRSLDPVEIWDTAERESVSSMVIVGDAFARPLLRHLAESERVYDLTALNQLYSSGAMLSADIKDRLLDHIRHMAIVDTIGGSEGALGAEVTKRGGSVETAAFQLFPSTKVFTNDGVEVTPGSGEVGYLAASGSIPYGYYKDPDKSAATFREINGVRYSFLGDMATVRADGSIHLIGRGNTCINTGGEKVYPEEVEEAAKTHPAIEDCLVFGIPDERFGQRVAAVAERAPGTETDAAEIIEHIRAQLAGYKAPRDILFVAQVPRTPTGKADYPAARDMYADRTAHLTDAR